MTILSFIITMALLHYAGYLMLKRQKGDIDIFTYCTGTAFTIFVSTCVFVSFDIVLTKFFGG